MALPFVVVGNFTQDGQGYAADHTRDERVSHEIPFVGLIELSYFPFGIIPSQDDGKQIVVDMVENVGQKQLAAETHHAPEGLEADGESRSPGGKMQIAEIDHTDVDDTLGSDTPV